MSLTLWIPICLFLANSPDLHEDLGPKISPFPQGFVSALEAHCYRCHSGDQVKGGFDLEIVVEDGSDGDPADWLTLLNVLRSGEMPPADEIGPNPQQRHAMVEILDVWQRHQLALLPESPGSVPPRRLSRTELKRTLKDLTGIEIDVDRHLPADASSAGFDNQGGHLSPGFVEQLFRIGEEVAQAAVISPEDEGSPKRIYTPADLETRGGMRNAGDHLYFFSRGSASTEYLFPKRGTYRFTVRGWGKQAGPDPVAFRLNVGSQLKETLIFPESRSGPGERTVDLIVRQGLQTVSLTFINDYYQPEDPNPAQRDRNGAIEELLIEGPLEGLSPTPFQKFALKGGGSPEQKLKRGMGRWLPRFWRQKVSSSQIQKMVDLAIRASAQDSPAEELLRSALIAAIVSPRFILRTEPDPTRLKSGEVRKLNDYELATRLSYFLWGTCPDEALLTLAKKGKLDEPAQLVEVTRRMLNDPRSRVLADDFSTQWLRIRDLQERAPDRKIFPDFRPLLLKDMQKETVLFFDHILREDRPIRELLNADYSFMNGRLARHYGLPGERGEAHQKVQINTPRGGGLISHGSVLLASSTRQRTSPVLRGKWVLEVLLDDAPPPAPPGAGNLPAPGESGSDLSLREQLEVHRRDPACATCHRRMDAIGFAMERFDAVGRYRQGFVDTKGELPDGTEIDGPGELRDLVEKELGFRRSLVTHLMTYALGRGLDSGDIPAISRLSRNLKADSTLQDLIEAIVLTDAFRKREIP
ncbi:hypothetical protein CBD41_05450 [bacterium TMED181]|nr:hypothetical protein [Planctomycetota bacterium]OUW44558.1 MAG: hypothetical protein CBD41_05450 [bacterium TMED181]